MKITQTFFLHSHNTETYCQCCKFLHSCSFYTLLFPVKQYKLNAVRITSDSTTQRAFGNVPNWYVTECSEGFMIYFPLLIPTNVKMIHINSCINLPIENMWPQWTKVILELLGWKRTEKYESYGPIILPGTSFSSSVLKPSK
jgi:hypothetical protein